MSAVVNLRPIEAAASRKPGDPSKAAMWDKARLSSTAGKYGYLIFYIITTFWVKNTFSIGEL